MSDKPVMKFKMYQKYQTVEEYDRTWWRLEDSKSFESIFAVIDLINKDNSSLYSNFIKFARLYSNQDFIGFGLYQFTQSASPHLLNSNRLTLNVIKSCIDSAAAKIAKSRPRAYFLTSGGDFTLSKAAKNLTKYCDGFFDQNNVYEIGQKCFVDSCITGIGAVKVGVDEDNGSVFVERVLPMELIVDQKEAIYGSPRQIHQIKYVDRHVLMELYPAQAGKLLETPPGKPGESFAGSRMSTNMVAVVESWHLPSSKNSSDGKHVISVCNATLFSEPYTKDYLPFVFFRWSEKMLGFYGQGLCEDLVGIQIAINKLLMSIQRANDLVAIPRVFVENGSKVNTDHISNEIGSVVKYTGTKPSFETAQGMNADAYMHLDRLYNKAYEISGISQLSASSKKPSGLDSGVAIREYQDIETERFALVAQRYEAFFMSIAKMVCSFSDELYTKNKDLSVKVSSNKYMETIEWKDVNYEEDKFLLRVFPTSLLPTTPVGKLQAVQELVQGGMLSREAGLSLLDYPDLEQAVGLANAQVDDIRNTIENIINDGVYDTPEPYQNLELAIQMAQSYYQKARTTKVPENRLELLRRFIDDCHELSNIDKPTMATVPVGQQPAPPPLAVPAPLPQSDLMPLQPQGVPPQ